MHDVHRVLHLFVPGGTLIVTVERTSHTRLPGASGSDAERVAGGARQHPDTSERRAHREWNDTVSHRRDAVGVDRFGAQLSATESSPIVHTRRHGGLRPLPSGAPRGPASSPPTLR